MRILSRLPVRRAPVAVATANAPVRRVVDAPPERPVQRPLPAEETPEPLAPARGLVIALGLGALGWALVAAFLLSR